MTTESKSPIDNLFSQLMGYIPDKAGQAFEIISSAVLSIVLNKDGKLNQYIEGLSGSRYQLDGIIDSSLMVEAKDYTHSNAKVGRGDLQKMQGALTDLPDITKGLFTSATNYTREAIRYAEGSETNRRQKKIVPVTICPIKDEDETGRVKKIIININSVYPDFQKGRYTVIFSEGEEERLNKMISQEDKNISEKTISYRIDKFYDDHFNIMYTLHDLLSTQYPQYSYDDTSINTCFFIDAFIIIQDKPYKINGIKFEDVPIVKDNISFSITPNGNATILVESNKLGINKLITDTDLKAAINRLYPKNGN